MACTDCLLNEKEQQESWDKALKDAKKYAIEKGVFVVVYKNDLKEARYMEASAAQTIGISGQFVSPVQ